MADLVDDPAEILSASARHVALRARQNPLWGRFLLRSAFSVKTLSEGPSQHLLRDLQRGIATGRLKANDLLTTILAASGAAIGLITAEVGLAEKVQNVARGTD